MSEATEADREKARRVLRSILVGTESTTVEIVAAALAEEREKARAEERSRVAQDLRDLVNDSGGNVWVRALLDFAESLDGDK